MSKQNQDQKTFFITKKPKYLNPLTFYYNDSELLKFVKLY